MAHAAGVSVKTASNVINHDGRMSDATRQHVQKIIRDLGYKRNPSASNLTRGRTHNLTLALPTLNAPYLSELAETVINTASSHGYTVLTRTYAPDTENDARALLAGFNDTISDGLIISLDETTHFVPSDFEVGYPVVALGSRSVFGRIDHVSTDDVQDAGLAIRFLRKRGARRIAIVGAHHAFDAQKLRMVDEGNAELRLRGVIEESDREGWSLDPRLVPVTGYEWTIGNGHKITEQLLSGDVGFDAILALNDSLAIGAISALQSAGLSIPQGVQVLGFDDIYESRYLHPPLTTVGSQLDWISEAAVDRLVDRIHGRDLRPATLMTSADVIVRATTLPAPSDAQQG